jgi:hypothetical protein
VPIWPYAYCYLAIIPISVYVDCNYPIFVTSGVRKTHFVISFADLLLDILEPAMDSDLNSPSSPSSNEDQAIRVLPGFSTLAECSGGVSRAGTYYPFS